MAIYKLLSVLLDYPDQELLDNLPAIRQAMAEDSEIDEDEQLVLRKFLSRLEGGELTEIQADYVQTFDLTAEHSLHLTHHLFGDDKNRGPALIDLAEMYKEYGIEVAGNELPDYLPLILEFADSLGHNEAQPFLCDAVKVFNVLADNLEKAGSHYAPLIRMIEKRANVLRIAA